MIIVDKMYLFENGMTMKREHGLTPNGNHLDGQWVLRDKNDQWIDFDRYRHDLIERHGLYNEFVQNTSRTVF